MSEQGQDALGRVEAVLRERARLLAVVPRRDEGRAEAVLVFRLRDERYGVELRQLWAVHGAGSLTSVPCTPSYVAGVANVRGEVVTVLDLAVALGLPTPAASVQTAAVLLVELAGRRVGLLVDELLGVERIGLDVLPRALSGRDFARGVAGGRVVLIDLEQLLSDARFLVDEEVA